MTLEPTLEPAGTRRTAQAVVLRSEAPQVQLQALLELAADDALILDDARGTRFAALGRAYTLRGDGPDRTRRLLSQLTDTTRSLCELPSSVPLAYGALSFFPSLDASAVWRGFASGEFVIPRVLYWLNGESAELYVIEPSGDRGRALGTLEQWRQRLEGSAMVPATHHARIVDTDEDKSREHFRAVVEQALDAIAKRRLDKVVAARSVTLTLAEPPNAAQILSALALAHPQAARFCLRRDQACFLGATPELLVERRGNAVLSEAVAGSAPANQEFGDHALLASEKDRREHAFVVEAVTQALSDVCSAATVPDAPEVRRSGGVLHLASRISGRLNLPLPHVLSLVERLHPTPALGGTPRAAALEQIARGEGFERGLYGAPLGFVDRDGDGRFVVALRSMVLRERQATLFAGAGIVEGSNPDREVEETRLKLRTLADVLLGSSALSEKRA